jgi:hypothetical protein
MKITSSLIGYVVYTATTRTTYGTTAHTDLRLSVNYLIVTFLLAGSFVNFWIVTVNNPLSNCAATAEASNWSPSLNERLNELRLSSRSR